MRRKARTLPSRLARQGVGLACLALLAAAPGCAREAAEDPDRPPARSPDEPRALQYHLEAAVVAPALRGDAAAVRAALEALVAGPADFEALFGAAGPALYAAYQAQIAAPFLAEAPAFLVGRIQAGDREVTVRRVGPAQPAHTVPGDQITLDAMSARLPMMSVWFSPPGQELGVRLEGFVYREGRFVALLKLHREITRLAEEQAKAPEAPEAPAAPAAPAAPLDAGAVRAPD